MKISHLHIDKFRHLEDLKFDFTYPKDFHDESKRGKPLDKICIIGQSATGKTGILELIANQFQAILGSIYDELNFNIISNSEANFSKENTNIVFEYLNQKINITKEIVNYNNSSLKIVEGNLINNKFLIDLPFNENLIFLNSNIISNKNLTLFNSHPNDIFEKYIDTFKNDLFSFNDTFIMNDDIDEEIILYLIKDFVIYLKKFTQKMSELIHKGLISDTKKLESEYKKWEKENPKILKDFAEKLNPLIHKLGLEIDIVNTEFPIPFRNIKTDEIISMDKLSTGTKGLLLSILPIYKLNTKDSIILIDEPERSLYPDIQMDLMEYYQNLAPKAQFIVATHSPFIAASFEPEERFILEFNEEGKVVVRRGTSPIGDDPNDMLYNDFGIDYINKYGKKAHELYLEKKRKLLFEENPMEKEKLLEEIETIGEKYNF